MSGSKMCKIISHAELDMLSPPNVLAPSAKVNYKRLHEESLSNNEFDFCKKKKRMLEVIDESFPPNRVCSSRLPIPGLTKTFSDISHCDYSIPVINYNEPLADSTTYDNQSMFLNFFNNKNIQLPSQNQDSYISNNVSDISFLPTPFSSFSNPDIQPLLAFQSTIINEKDNTFTDI